MANSRPGRNPSTASSIKKGKDKKAVPPKTPKKAAAKPPQKKVDKKPAKSAKPEMSVSPGKLKPIAAFKVAKLDKKSPKVAAYMRANGHTDMALLKDSNKKLYVQFSKGKNAETIPLSGLKGTAATELAENKGAVEIDRFKKIIDVGDVVWGGKTAEYWEHYSDTMFYTPDANRKGSHVPASYRYFDPEFLLKYYGLRSIEYGNWLTQQHRLDYTAGLGLALYDLQNIIKFSAAQMSLKGKLSVALGARGSGPALAHYEGDSTKTPAKLSRVVINITRHPTKWKVTKMMKKFGREVDPTKFTRANMMNHGGNGSFAHEFAHALDNVVPLYSYVVDIFGKGDWLSFGRSTATITPAWTLDASKAAADPYVAMSRLMTKIIWGEIPEVVQLSKLPISKAKECFVEFLGQKSQFQTWHKNIYKSEFTGSVKELKENKAAFDKMFTKWTQSNKAMFVYAAGTIKFPLEKKSRFYHRVKEEVEKTDLGDYYLRRNEIFARAFEAYVTFVMKEKDWQNKFLQKNAFRMGGVYLTDKETEEIRPEMETLLSCIKKYL